MSNQYPGFAFLGYDCLGSPTLLEPFDRAWPVAEANPSQIDPVSGRAFGAIWLDAADAIRSHVNPLLDRVALHASLQAEDLRKRGDQRKLDEILRLQRMRP